MNVKKIWRLILRGKKVVDFPPKPLVGDALGKGVNRDKPLGVKTAFAG